MSDTIPLDPNILKQFLYENLSEKLIKERLFSLGFDEKMILRYLAELKKLKNAKRLTMGFVYLLSGGIVGLISCILAIVNPVPELHNWFLYGLTSVAILLACYGLYNIFE